MSPTTQVVNKTISSHTSSSDIITLTNVGDGVGGACQYIILYDAAVVVALCPANCASCTSNITCTLCATDAVFGLYYWDSTAKICTTICSVNYY